MIYAALCLMGLISLTRLPVELYPDVSFGQISIIIYIRGGIPPTEVESLICRPVEEAVNTVTHLEDIMSISKEGEATIVLSFEQGIDMQLAAMEVREKFAKVKDKLPKECEKPVIAQYSQTDVPVMILAVTSRKRTPEEMRVVVDEQIKERLKRVKGVANVEVGGGRERKILVEIDEKALYKYHIPFNQIVNSLGANNLNLLVGELSQKRDKVLLRLFGQLEDINAIKDTVVVSRSDGSAVRVKDVAEVKDSYMEADSYSRINVKPVVSLYVQKESKGNTIEIVDGVMKELDVVKKMMPKDVEIITTSNQSEFIKKSVANLRDALLRGAVMILLVLMFFMCKWKPIFWGIIPGGLIMSLFVPEFIIICMLLFLVAYLLSVKDYRPILIVAMSIPISLIITFALMDMSNMIFPGKMNLTVNFMTLFGLALGVGILVDNSIVVFENIVTKSEQGMSFYEAAEVGSTEMGVVIFGSTLTTVIVFLPMIFISKSISLLYGGVAWTVTFSLTVSLFVSLMIVPLFTSRLKEVSVATDAKAIKEGVLKSIYRFQEKALLFVFRRRFLVLSIAVLLFCIAMFVFSKMGKEYMGSTEQSKFTTFIEMPTGAKLDASDEVVRKVEDMLKEVPEVKDFTSRVEGWSSKIYVNLVPVTERKRSMQEVIESLRPKVQRLQPAFIYFEEQQEVGTKELILNVYGYDYDILREIAVAVTTRMSRIPYFTDSKIRMREGRPELWIKVDKEKAANFGLSTQEVADTVHGKVRGLRATLYHTKSSEVETIARLKEKDRRTVKDIHLLSVAKTGHDTVKMDQIADFEYGLGPSEVWRKNRSRMIQVSANIGQIPLGNAVDILMKELSDLKLPEDYYFEIGGDYPTLQKTQKELTLTIIITLLLIYIVLASMFESYKQPFITMLTVLLATTGAIGSLYFTKTAVSMGAMIGMMMLAGIVVSNGIILVDHANYLKTKRKNIFRILIQAARDRLRPVLMTKSTAIMGLVPLALDNSEGANLWKPLAVTVIGGLAFATPLTLVLVPAIFTIFEQFGQYWHRLFSIRFWKALAERTARRISELSGKKKKKNR